MNEFSITNKLTFKDYKNVVFILHFNNTFGKVYLSLAVTYLATYFITTFIFHTRVFSNDILQFGVIFFCAAIFLSIVQYLNALRIYKSNKLLQEKTTTTFTLNSVSKLGETFNNSYEWSKLYKIKIVNNWLLLYWSKNTASFVKFNEEDLPNIKSLKNMISNSNLDIKYKW